MKWSNHSPRDWPRETRHCHPGHGAYHNHRQRPRQARWQNIRQPFFDSSRSPQKRTCRNLRINNLGVQKVQTWESIIAKSGIPKELVFNRQVIVRYSDSDFDHPNHWMKWKRVEKAQREGESQSWMEWLGEEEMGPGTGGFECWGAGKSLGGTARRSGWWFCRCRKSHVSSQTRISTRITLTHVQVHPFNTAPV